MAYLAFPDLGGIAAARRPVDFVPEPTPAPADRRLSALEWSVVMIARGDRLSSLRRPGRLATALAVLFDRRNPALADERLEALRRTAVLAWHTSDPLPAAEVAAFLAAGFTSGQYETLIASIAAARRPTDSPQIRPLPASAATTASVRAAAKSGHFRTLHGHA